MQRIGGRRRTYQWADAIRSKGRDEVFPVVAGCPRRKRRSRGQATCDLPLRPIKVNNRLLKGQFAASEASLTRQRPDKETHNDQLSDGRNSLGLHHACSIDRSLTIRPTPCLIVASQNYRSATRRPNVARRATISRGDLDN